MKIHKKISLIITNAAMLVFGGCKKVLEEHPKSNVVPAFLATPTGLLGALSGVYNDLRSSYGTEGFTLTLKKIGGLIQRLLIQRSQ